MAMLSLWNGLHPFPVVCQLSAGHIRALRAALASVDGRTPDSL